MSAPTTDKKWRWLRTVDGERLEKVGILADGTLHNPNGYPPELVRATVEAAIEREHEWRSEAAKRAAVTRKDRQERLVYRAAKELIAGKVFAPRTHCSICGKGLGDPESIERGIGSDCWQKVLKAITVQGGGRAFAEAALRRAEAVIAERCPEEFAAYKATSEEFFGFMGREEYGSVCRPAEAAMTAAENVLRELVPEEWGAFEAAEMAA